MGEQTYGRHNEIMVVNDDGSINTNLYSDGEIVSSASPLPVTSTTSNHKDVEGKGFITVGTTPVELTFTGVTESIIISAAIANTGIIYIGKSNVTSDGSNAIAFLDVAESLTLDYTDTNNPLYVVASIADQSVMVGAAL